MGLALNRTLEIPTNNGCREVPVPILSQPRRERNPTDQPTIPAGIVKQPEWGIIGPGFLFFVVFLQLY
jgi:hypothetical protein